jgi:hypothetical protein
MSLGYFLEGRHSPAVHSVEWLEKKQRCYVKAARQQQLPLTAVIKYSQNTCQLIRGKQIEADTQETKSRHSRYTQTGSH